MSPTDLIADLERLGVRLWAEDGRLRYRAPQGVLTEDRRALLRAHRSELLRTLSTVDGDGAAAVEPAPESRHEPFPLTDVQAAYLLGRRDTFDYGGVACHGYGELAYSELDPDRLAVAWRQVIRRHDMLRAVVDRGGSQRVLPNVPEYRIAVLDVRQAEPAAAEAAAAGVRAELDHKVYDPGRWPLFELRVTRMPGRDLLHFSIDFLICDFVSIEILLDELHHWYHRPDDPLPALDVTFRDYLAAERRLRSGPRYEADRDYWWRRIDELPPAPELPLAPGRGRSGPARFTRWQATLPPQTWAALRRQAAAHGVTPSGAVLAAYAEVVGAWSRQPRFTLNLTLLNRMPLHPRVGALVGDFTSVDLLAIDATAATAATDGTSGAGFAARAAAVQAQLFADLEHRLCSGVEVIREIARRGGAEAALMPVVFTSAIGLSGERDGEPRGELLHGSSQTPQVWIDCQNIERDGGLATSWDVRDGVLRDGVAADMFDAYATLLHRLADDPRAWDEPAPVPLPAAQRTRREAYLDSAGPLPDRLLHEDVFAQAARAPHRPALVAGGTTLTYGELAGRAAAVAARLRADGTEPGDIVAIVMDKGVEQVAGVLGTLLAGAVYLPIDTGQPPARRDLLLADAGVRRVLGQSWVLESAAPLPAGVAAVAVDGLAATAVGEPPATGVRPDDPAYVIYTSGSTGVPKGVVISHRGALNTIADVTARFAVGADDRVLGLAGLGFDLSVYDVFGTLAAGGVLVLPDADRRGDPSHWADLLARHGVTVWNSVPAQLQMLHDYLAAVPGVGAGPLRLALLSGDWIPVPLPDRIRARVPGLRVVSLGGATEASIWSIYHPVERVDPGWASIPYGRPLTNQTVHVLDHRLRERPEWVPGELYIGGAGVALGYLGDETLTAARFITHPATGERLYRTGDLGRQLPGGDIEFLGREDTQVKVRGHRIELAEVESALLAHPAVGNAAALVDGAEPMQRRLAAAVEAAPRDGAAGRDRALAERLHADAAAAAGEVCAGVDTARLAAFARQLDETAMRAMLCTLREQGLFATDGRAPSGECAHTADEIMARARVAGKHHRLIRRWLRGLTEHGFLARDDDGRYRPLRTVTAEDVAEAWRGTERMQREVRHGAELIRYFRVATEHLPELMRGELDPVRLLFPEGRLDIHESAYNDNTLSRYLNQVVVAACRGIARHAHPEGRPLRLLEVGAGVGGTSIDLIPALAGLDVDYLFTDVSQFFLNKAAERFAEFPWVRYGLFDLNADPRAQQHQPNSFDVIVCANVMHYARHAGHALARLRELLTAGGSLVFIETTKDNYQILTSMEFLFDATNNDFDDVRRGRDDTFIARSDWLDLIAEAGGSTALCLPEVDDPLAEVGMFAFVARFKSDRQPLDAAELTGHLRARLPEHMVPGRLEVLDALPLTANGKVDRRALAGLLGRPDAGAAVTNTAGAQPLDDLERRLAQVWAEVLAVAEVGRDQDFFSLGGDSLLAAQLVTRLIEQVPEAADAFFDSLLRVVLEAASVGSLADHLRKPQDGPAAADSAGSPVVELRSPPADRPVVLVHGPQGTLEGYGEAAGAGDLGVVLSDPHSYVAAAPDRLIERVAGAYAHRLRAEGHDAVHLVGCRLGAVLAVEMARQLAEAGGAVTGVTVIAGYPPPYVVEDELLTEYLYALELGVDPAELGYPSAGEVAAQIAAARGRNPVLVPDGSLARGELGEVTQADRLGALAEAVAALGTANPGEAAERFPVFRQTVRATGRHEVMPYFGDITLLRPAGEEPAALADMTAFWQEVCLGELRVVDVPGTAADCLAGPRAAAVAELIGDGRG
nr:non-ribosomal peptide synthetase [Dactylosporangium thailandense]